VQSYGVGATDCCNRRERSAPTAETISRPAIKAGGGRSEGMAGERWDGRTARRAKGKQNGKEIRRVGTAGDAAEGDV